MVFLHKKISFVFIALCFIAAPPARAQQWNYDGLNDITGHMEVNFTGGINSFLGDIGGNKGEGGPFIKDFTFKTIRPLAGISLSYNINRWAAVSAGLNFTMVTDADSLISNTGNMERWRYYRNLSFRSNIFELYTGATFYPTMYFENKYELRNFVPFVSVGLGIFHFNPQAKLDGEWINLQPLSLEGQGFPEYTDRKKYALNGFYIPASIGVKYYLNNRYAFSTGLNVRKTFTDYIDDISTTYIEPELFDAHLSSGDAILAKQLYARSIRPEKVRPGVLRANSSSTDSYFNFFVSLHIRVRNDGYHSPY